MNKVRERSQKDASAKFYFTSKKMYHELKITKILLYVAAIVPIVLKFIPSFNSIPQLSFLYTLISFGLTILNEILNSFQNNHKEMAIIEHQLYESEITGSTFSKIEYDREATNNTNELAIRKGLPAMKKYKEKNGKYPVTKVPEGISDDYSYLYLCRMSSATTKYLLSRIFYIYIIILTLVLFLFVSLMFIQPQGSSFNTNETSGYFELIICFYPLVIPFIRDCFACKKAESQCSKICADIDNFFADGDASVERLARFYYYVQNIEFEMMLARPAIFNIFPKIFSHGVAVLQDGVTVRFLDAINELQAKAYYQLSGPRGKELITKTDYDIIELQRKDEAKRLREKRRAEKEKEEKLKAEKEREEKRIREAIEREKQLEKQMQLERKRQEAADKKAQETKKKLQLKPVATTKKVVSKVADKVTPKKTSTTKNETVKTSTPKISTKSKVVTTKKTASTKPAAKTSTTKKTTTNTTTKKTSK